MNIFRYLGDCAHIVSFILLLHKIVRGKSAAGISLRTQEMYAGARHPAPGAARAQALRPDLVQPPPPARHAQARPPQPHPPCLVAVVFATRYIDLLWNFSSAYNYLLKLLFIGASAAIVYFIRYGAPQKATYNAEEDSFPVQYLLAPCAVLGVIVNQDHTSWFEMLWAFSIYLEAVAILPQLFLLQKQGEVCCSASRAHECLQGNETR